MKVPLPFLAALHSVGFVVRLVVRCVAASFAGVLLSLVCIGCGGYVAGFGMKMPLPFSAALHSGGLRGSPCGALFGCLVRFVICGLWNGL